MHRRDRWQFGQLGEWQGPIIDMRMNYVEVAGTSAVDVADHRKLKADTQLGLALEAQCARASRRKMRVGLSIAGSEQRDLVATTRQFLGNIRDDAFRAAIEFRWNSLV